MTLLKPRAGVALVEAVSSLVDHAVDGILLRGRHVASAAEAKRLLVHDAETEGMTDRIQRIVVLATPVVRRLLRGAKFTKVPWVMVATSSVATGVAVRNGVRELQVLASLIAHRLEEATGRPGDPALVKKLAVALYLDPKRDPDLRDHRLHLVRLTRKWVVSGVFGRNTSKRAARALDAAERLDAGALAAGWDRNQTTRR
jgi:hypothetical protein